MGLEHLLEALERDADAQVEQTLAQARAEADRITTESATALERRRRETTAARDSARVLEVEHAVTLARREARRSILEARERLLERVFAAARAELPAAAAGPVYRASLPAALSGALAAVGGEQAVIRCPEMLARELERARPPGSTSVPVEVDVASGSGFRVASADGAVEVDDTLESRLDRLRFVLARRVLALLELEA
jgi:V/A-type H+/Na+-transporting ATPase subunit E